MNSLVLLFVGLFGLAVGLPDQTDSDLSPLPQEISQNDAAFKSFWSWYIIPGNGDFMGNVVALQRVYRTNNTYGNQSWATYNVFFAATDCVGNSKNCDAYLDPNDGSPYSETTCKKGAPHYYPVPISSSDAAFQTAWSWYISPAANLTQGKAGTIQRVLAYNQATPTSKNEYEVNFVGTDSKGAPVNCYVSLYVNLDGSSYKTEQNLCWPAKHNGKRALALSSSS